MAYHIRVIESGVYGELSKIREELEEVEDSVEQGCKFMELVELSDLYGAIEGYLEKHHPTVVMDDLRIMSMVTKRAFMSGVRKCRE